ncbi:MAG: GNAT family N-acetyltransferase [Acidobacteria bacterium]|nr:GNAT family N-acetyltransferase [Acidobacteriota bacterium]
MHDIAGLKLVDAELLLRFVKLEAHPVHQVPTCFFQMVHRETGAEMGGINLRVGSTPHIERYAGHLGYTVFPRYRGRRYAARSVRLLVAVARLLDMAEVWITCDPENVSSRRSAELAGAVLVEIVDVPADCIIHRSGHPRKCRYRLDLFRIEQ